MMRSCRLAHDLCQASDFVGRFAFHPKRYKKSRDLWRCGVTAQNCEHGEPRIFGGEIFPGGNQVEIGQQHAVLAREFNMKL